MKRPPQCWHCSPVHPLSHRHVPLPGWQAPFTHGFSHSFPPPPPPPPPAAAATEAAATRRTTTAARNRTPGGRPPPPLRLGIAAR
ncbi:hypothetical protein FKM82_029638 [Ascaphus truei]